MSFTKGRWEYDRAQAEVWNLDDVKIASLAETELVHQNGALIAAAPDLYEACMAVLPWIKQYAAMTGREELTYLQDLISAAIAKAEGK
jgi:hypothetical protein